jgi:hypothetical protein
MKWVKLRTDPDLAFMTAQERNCFKVYDALAPVSKAKGKLQMQGTVNRTKTTTKTTDVFEPWTPKPYSYPKTGFGRIEREKYEQFCGGWLGFYDDIVRNKEAKHIIHFEWDKKNHKVTIWISPPAVDRVEKKYQDFIKYLPVIDPPNTPPPPPPPRNP